MKSSNRNSKLQFTKRNARLRRRGVAFVYLAVGMILFLGITGYVVDVGHLHMKEAQAMRAADSASLAGAMQLANDGNAKAAADKAAIEYAKLNGYDPAQANVTFQGGIDPKNPNWYTVYIARPEPLFFIRALPYVGSQRLVGAKSTAEFVAAVPLTIKNGGGSYGKRGPVSLSLFGPQAEYQWGDPYSTIWTDNKGTLNKDHLNFHGYNFEMNVPADYSAKNGNQNIVNVELFDPDTYNSDGSNSPNGTSEWDEIRDPYSGRGQQPISKYTQTRFTLYKVLDPNDSSKDQKISDATYRNDPATNNKWVIPPGFNINTSVWGTGKYRINVESLDGSSENGFDMRAGPPLKPGDPFDVNNDVNNIAATDAIPINFNTSGLTTITLGEVPAAAAGRDLTIQKFDTDVKSESVVYTSDPPASNQPAGGWPGKLAGNAEWVTDDPIKLPADYKAATWYATYKAGWQDTSLWKMSYSAAVTGSPGHVRLVGSNNKPY